MAGKPHVSPALAALRLWVTLAAGVVVVAAAAQMLVFGFVHGTDVRHIRLAPMLAETAPMVVLNSDTNRARDEVQRAAAKQSGLGEVRVTGQPADVNRVVGPNDEVLRRASGLAAAIGSVACVALAFLCALGVVIAAGGSVPGVERAVAASTWALVLALVCLPWGDVLHSMPTPGIFGDYDAMVHASEQVSVHPGGWVVLLVKHLALPSVAVVCATLVCLWFRSGVERGVIYTSISQIDRAVEREVSAIRESGVASRKPRAIGALYRAMGDPPMPEEPGAPTDTDAPAIAGSLLRREPPVQRVSRTDRSIGEASPGDGLKRPI